MILRGVLILITRYWYVWIGLALFALGFYYLNPNLGSKVTVPQTVEINWETYEGWSCAIYPNIALIYEHSADVERCRQNTYERYKLYVGKDVLVEERYMSGVFLAGMINYKLLNQLKKKPELTTRSSLRDTARTDI